jgi:hypothetical protein
MPSSEDRSERVMELAEEFLNRYRKGERPPLKEYIERHPDLAAEIKEVFPAMAMMENIAVADSSLEGESTGQKPAKAGDVALKQLGDYRIIREIGHGGMGGLHAARPESRIELPSGWNHPDFQHIQKRSRTAAVGFLRSRPRGRRNAGECTQPGRE